MAKVEIFTEQLERSRSTAGKHHRILFRRRVETFENFVAHLIDEILCAFARVWIAIDVGSEIGKDQPQLTIRVLCGTAVVQIMSA